MLLVLVEDVCRRLCSAIPSLSLALIPVCDIVIKRLLDLSVIKPFKETNMYAYQLIAYGPDHAVSKSNPMDTILIRSDQ